ncbi:MAG TPA: DmsC/YnfH family molybdoenzyme membrane anchor subunit [Verrucomicrobiaceae bacterium]|jgi:Fe-S-cluster-containing dehydrogenase component/DMSO reductase anchor subunit
MMMERERHATLVDDLLAAQMELGTAVARFSGWHEMSHDEPLQAHYYRDLIPLHRPSRGEQYAFEVNLDQCTGCKACVAACHSQNGLDEDESWRDVGLLLGDEYTPYQQTITSACHHCADPACANGCPVLAYEKEPETGIVRHLDDQCIGCSYCMLKCPYDVPKYNKKRGIVRKCDMCQGRLAAGEAPACVQACPTQAIAIRIVKIELPEPESRLLPGLMVSDYTRPTTRYISSKPVPPTADAADVENPRLEAPHSPLAVMLVLTQLATGALLFAQNNTMRWLGFCLAVAGLAASISHLGQPLKAWRCFLGWRKSWLSREILAFGLFAPAALLSALHAIPNVLAVSAGLVSVFCSAMVYADTRRPFWALKWTGAKFLGTVLLGGSALASCFQPALATASVIHAMIKLGWEMLFLSSDDPRDRRSLRLLLGPLKWLHVWRFTFGLFGIAAMLAQPVAGLFLLLAGEFMERHLFFRAAAAWKMPGHS